MKKFCWFHNDLDGVVSYITLKWFHPNENIEYKSSSYKSFKSDWESWEHNIPKYGKIYILDLDVSDYADIVDHPNVIVIDHHNTHKNIYKNATGLVKIYPSAAKLTYKIFSKLYPDIELTNAQKKLILLADDYDSYTLQIPISKNLNNLFWNTQKSVETFIKWFITGFHEFNVAQQTIINQYIAKIEVIKKNLSIYAAKIKIQGKMRYVCAAFSNEATNDIADALKDDYGAEIAIVVNLKSKAISFRRSTNNESNVDVSKLAEQLANGGGHEYAAGGEITDQFMQFTRLLKQIK